MKRSLIFILCAVLLIISAVAVSALEHESVELTTGKDAESQAILDSFSEYIEQSAIITEKEDGVTVVEFAPLSSSITVDEVLGMKEPVTVTQEPQYSTKLPDYSYTTNQTHTPTSIEQNYLYSLYNDEYKSYYRSMEQAVKNLDEMTEYFPASPNTDIVTLFHSFLFDNPKYFYVSTTCTIYSNGAGKYAIGFVYSVGNQSGDYCGYGYGKLTETLKTKILAKKAAFDQTVNNFISTIPANAPDFIKERLIYAKILRNSFYNLDAVLNNLWDGLANDNWTAYGIIVNGMGVCESYSEAFQTICHAVGIPCTGIIGTAGGGHKWNAVKIGGQWYQCDITFDDPIGGEDWIAYSYYFNLTDQQMANDGHDWSNCDYPVPVCTATEYGRTNFFNIYDEDREGTLHFFSNRCDITCENCSYTRFAKDHEYVDSQSKICIHCGYNRPDGWTFEDNNWFYYENNNRVRDAWRMAEYGKRYLGYNGIMVTYDWVYKDSGDFPVYVGGDGYIVRNSWVQHQGEHFYCDENGYRVHSSWIKSGDRWAYINEYGFFLTNTCWIYHENEFYYIENGYRVENAWLEFSGNMSYVGEDGKRVKNDFIKDDFGFAFIESDGYFKGRNNWLFHNQKWYFLEKGYAVTNDWRLDSIGWCYLGEDGAMLTNTWVKDSVGWCYLPESGYWDGVYYPTAAFTKNGWYFEDGSWYFYEADVKITNEWRADSKGWCFLSETGAMVTNNFVEDSVGSAYITEDGYFYYNVTGWKLVDNTWYYVENGYAVKNEWRADSKGWCYLSETGAMVTNNFVEDSVGSAYITEDGYFYYNVTGWKLVDNTWYYVENGYAVTDQWRQDSKGWCYLGKDGAMLTNVWLRDSIGWCFLDGSGYWDGIYHQEPAA